MSRRALDFRAFDEVVADLDRLKHGYTKGGNWDLGQACWHLNALIRGSLDGFTGKPAPWIARLFGPLFVRWMLKKRRMPAGFKTPAQFEPPAIADEAAEVWQLMQLIERFQKHTGALHPSPFAGPLTNEQWRELHLVHCSHHLSFLHPTDEA
jgi:hypothetical protein